MREAELVALRITSIHLPGQTQTERSIPGERALERHRLCYKLYVHSSKFQCLGEHLALYSQVYLKSRSKRMPGARMKEGLERINGEAGPKIN